VRALWRSVELEGKQMDKRTQGMRKGIGILEKKITSQVDRIESTLDSSMKNVLRELGKLRELRQDLILKREILERISVGGKKMAK
jgi:hypothetical protein